MDEPMSSEERPRRDLDEVSIASDFSIIPESFEGMVDDESLNDTLDDDLLVKVKLNLWRVGPEDNLGVEGEAMASGGSLVSLRSKDLQPSTAALTSYGKVLFHNIQATYTADTDIAVSYVLTSSVVAKSSDRVALYRVGFGSPQDYLGYQWAPTPSKDHLDNGLPLTVVFKANNLPKDAGEFFQFCYVTHEGRIVGVSTPLQLLAVGGPGAGGAVCGVLEDEEVEGDESMIMVRTNESVLHDRINKLEREKESMVVEVRVEKESGEERKRELEDKTQQLNMCQHHLQALETKMKKETGEKCEIMGRIGQVVEEKGHLEDRVRTLERSLTTATTKSDALQTQCDQTTALNRKMEEEVLTGRKEREQLDHAIKDCQEELCTTQQKLKDVEGDFVKVREERDGAVRELEIWTSSAAADQTEKNLLAIKFSTVNEELISKLEELDQSKREAKELELKLADTVFELMAAREHGKGAESRVRVAEEERDVQKERQVVVGQDNTQLKSTIAQLKEKVEELTESQKREVSGREAAETIASDLSRRLQQARAEYTTLTKTNFRLAKKVKKLRAALGQDLTASGAMMSDSEHSVVSSWLHADVDADGGITEALVGGEGGLARGTMSVLSGDMVHSFRNSEMGGSESRTVCTSCSDNTRELSEAVHRKMEDIVSQLSLQISSLKSQLRDQADVQQSEVAVQQSEVAVQQSEAVVQQSEAVVQQSEAVQQEMETQQQTESEEAQPAEATAQEVSGQQEDTEEQQTDSSGQVEQQPVAGEEREAVEVEEQQGAAVMEGERQVLYSNTFLPTAPTAPVFLPQPRETQSTSAPPCPTPTAPSHLVQDSIPSSTQPSAPSQLSVSNRGPAPPQYRLPAASHTHTFLPPPLLPETTPTAIHAAVMSQFSSLPHPTNTESDDEDFHSTSDDDAAATPLSTTHQQPQQPQPQPHGGERHLLECPLCSLSFPVSTIRLLEEHIHSHLEHVCPICSVAFQRNSQKKFEEHVQSHFPTEDDEGSTDGGSLGCTYV